MKIDITECRLVDLLQITRDDCTFDEEMVYSAFQEFLRLNEPLGEISISMSKRTNGDGMGAFVRYTESRDWIRFVKYLVDKSSSSSSSGSSGSSGDGGDGVVVIVDCGWQFHRLFREDRRVAVVACEEAALEALKVGLARHVTGVVCSNPGVAGAVAGGEGGHVAGVAGAGVFSVAGVFRSG